MDSSMHDALLAPEMLANPYPYLAHLRVTAPVHWNALHNSDDSRQFASNIKYGHEPDFA